MLRLNLPFPLLLSGVIDAIKIPWATLIVWDRRC
jgi:hypothetical protein